MVVLFFVLMILLVAPVLGSQLSSFIANMPGYVTKLQAVISDPEPALGAKISVPASAPTSRSAI